MPSFRRYNGMFSMHSPREQVVVQTDGPVSQLASVQQLLSPEPAEPEFAASHQEATGSSLDPVPSPCSGVCVLSKGSEICTGCFRTKAEITVWMRVSNTERGLIVNRAAQRKLADTIVDEQVCSVELCLGGDGVDERDGNLSG